MQDFLVGHGVAVLWWGIAAIAIVSAVLVVWMRNPVHSAVYLVLTFLCVAALFVMRQAEFLAAVQVFVYAGGIIVLFLFVIFLVNIEKLRVMLSFQTQWLAAVVIGALLLVLLFFAFAGSGTEAVGESAALRAIDGKEVGNTEAVGWALYTKFLIPFEVASVLLLVAMIGAIVLGKRDV